MQKIRLITNEQQAKVKDDYHAQSKDYKATSEKAYYDEVDRKASQARSSNYMANTRTSPPAASRRNLSDAPSSAATPEPKRSRRDDFDDRFQRAERIRQMKKDLAAEERRQEVPSDRSGSDRSRAVSRDSARTTTILREPSAATLLADDRNLGVRRNRESWRTARDVRDVPRDRDRSRDDRDRDSRRQRTPPRRN